MPNQREPAWLHERNNDPYGTPSRHPFWGTVEAERLGDYKVFQRDGRWFAYNVRQNYWMKLASREEAVELAQGPRLDMWA